MKTKKSLGQHWLRSEAAREQIVKAAELNPASTVIEVGPGEGFLTEALLKTGANVIAIEKDDRLIEFLQTKFATEIANGKLKLIHDDILSFDFLVLGTRNYQLVANIPYYITGEILRKFLGAPVGRQPSQMVLLVQKEVAERIIAKDHKESLLSISVKAYGEPTYVKTVPRGAFQPAPNVDSAIIAINHISKSKLQPDQEELFWQIVHQGFAHKRKQLRNNLSCSTEVFAACKIDPTARAETLSLTDWLCLTKNWIQ